MSLPDGVTEAAFIRVVEHVGRVLSKKFTFPGSDEEDVRQLVALWAWEGLPRFRAEAGNLESYIFSHCRNRCINKARDEVSRTDSPCARCHAGEPCCDGRACAPYFKWAARNQSKAHIARPLGIGPILGMTTASSVEPDVIGAELSLLIDQKLPIDLRPDYLRLLAGEPVPKPRRLKVQQAVAGIIGRDDLLQGEAGAAGQVEHPDCGRPSGSIPQLAEVT